MDDVLTTGKYEIQTTVKTLLQERLEKEDIGITITNAVIQDAEVPTQEVTQAFKNVEDAKQGMETATLNYVVDAADSRPKYQPVTPSFLHRAPPRIFRTTLSRSPGSTGRR